MPSVKSINQEYGMITLWRDDRELFDKEEHRRNVIESIGGAEKQRLGHVLFSKKDELQKKRNEIGEVICSNFMFLFIFLHLFNH